MSEKTKISFEQIRKMISECGVHPGQVWRHHKGQLFKIESITLGCDSQELVVTYYDCGNDHYCLNPFSRNLSTFVDKCSLVQEYSLWLTKEEREELSDYFERGIGE